MNEINTGGPAYPTNNWQKMVPQASGYHEGMTLRDYFAAQAMTGAQIWDAILNEKNANFAGGNGGVRQLAETAYAVADAMLKARQQ